MLVYMLAWPLEKDERLGVFFNALLGFLAFYSKLLLSFSLSLYVCAFSSHGCGVRKRYKGNWSITIRRRRSIRCLSVIKCIQFQSFNLLLIKLTREVRSHACMVLHVIFNSFFVPFMNDAFNYEKYALVLGYPLLS